MVFQHRLQVVFPFIGEEESSSSPAQFLPVSIGRGKDSKSMTKETGQFVNEACAVERGGGGGEFRGEAFQYISY